MNIWEEFPENARRMAVEVANHVIDSVRFVPWTPEQMGAFWRRRSYDQIVASGEVNVCVPCIDTAALATVYLHGKGLGAALRLYTGQGAAEDFVAGKKRKLHLDATTLFFVDGQPYELDIGAGDITLLKDADVAAGRLLTTRPNEPFWSRHDVSAVTGSILLRERKEPLVELLLQKRTRQLPFGLAREDFYRVNLEADDGDEFWTHAQGYDTATARIWNDDWTEGVRHIFSGLKPFNYKE